jgi:hypothetical protein
MKFIFVSLMAALSGCTTAAITLDSSYTMVKSGLIMAAGNTRAPIWLDNDRFVVATETLSNDRFKTPRKDLVVWNTVTGHLEPAPNGMPWDINCYDPDTGYLRAGPIAFGTTMGGLTGQLRPLPKIKDTGVVDVACRAPVEGELPGDLREQDLKLLWRLVGNDGYLWPRASGPFSLHIPMALYDVAGHKVADMPFGTIEAQNISYVPFNRTYLIGRQQIEEFYNDSKPYHVPGALIEDDPHIGWWLYPDGKVEKALIPPRTLITPKYAGKKSSMMYYATVLGILFKYNTRDYLSGAYLALDEKRLVKVMDGAPDNFGVSPDGCKVAFWYALKLGNTEEELAYIDLCRVASR